tara:strand:- start:526 stop:2175 length:1650 start_codon:yes stop_codon:yes gene_type:complete
MPGALSRVPVWLLSWLIAVAAALLFRPPLPVDETRYLAVAWEMWQRGDFLVPHLNGEAYHHKPPLLFWLMNAGWSVFGVNDWWPRLVAPLFALASLWWTARLARAIWPDDEMTRTLAPVILVGAAFWSVFQTLTMFDMMLAACALAGIHGTVAAWRTGSWLPWLGVALAIGVGVLAKGPAILLHILPVALFAPWWGPALSAGPDRPLVSWRAWYARLGVAVLLGAAIALAWAIPAGIRGGPEYREMIFWGQSAGRIVESFDHARPIWWYLVLLPPLLLPWVVWPRVWRSLGKGRIITFADGGLRILVTWALPALVIFSIISGKQLHYLLPEFAAFALFFARALSRNAGEPGRRFDSVVVAIFFVIVGAILMLLPDDPTFFEAPAWFDRIDTFWGFLLILTGAALGFLGRKPAQTAAGALAVAMSMLVLVIHLSAKDSLSFAYDLRPIAMSLKKYEDAGRPLANFGYYHGQYQFLGRLQKPMTVLGVDQSTTVFVDAHPDAIIVAYYYIDEPQPVPGDITPLETFRFRDFKVVFWQGKDLQRHPELGNRS